MPTKNKPVSHLQDTGHSWLENSAPAAPQQFTEFPKRVFHKSSPDGVVVASKEEQDALGGDWVESPADLKADDQPKSDTKAKAALAEPKPDATAKV